MTSWMNSGNLRRLTARMVAMPASRRGLVRTSGLTAAAALHWRVPQDLLVVRGAREHNLKNITVELPRDRLIVITGLSGSGKSSLAFDTIYAEGQRRYVESLSAYARQFLGQMEKPDVDQIDGLSARPSPSTRRAPAATRARRSARSPRSTTTCACSSPASAIRTAPSAVARSRA